MSARFRLNVFGGIQLDGPDGPLTGAAVQRRRLAVLALMAGAGMSRERLVAYLWPESSEERGRHGLAQLLYGLRRDFGEDVLGGGATALRLNNSIISSDLDEFETANARSDWARMAELYRGPFLDGFHLSGCVEFERWVDQERSRLALRAQTALETLAERAGAEGDLAGAVSNWERLAALTPFDSRIVLRLMQALVAAGDRGRAIKLARAHDTLLQSELGTRADPALLSFAASLASTADPAPVPSTQPIRTLPQVEAAQPEPAVLSGAPAHGAAATAPVAPSAAEPGRAATRQQRKRWLWMRFAIPTVAVAALWFGLASQRSPTAREFVVVADLQNRTGDAVFEPTVSLALSAALRQSPHVYVMPSDRIRQTLQRMRRPATDTVLNESLAREVAQRENVSRVLLPTLTQLDSTYTLTVQFLDPESGDVLNVVEARAAGREEVIDALDRVARQTRRKLGEPFISVRTRTVALPKMTTASLDALKKYADGRRAFARNHLEEAALLYQQAVRLDSTFAAAHSALGALYYYLNRPAAGNVWFEKAQAHLANLPERDQVLLRAEEQSWRGNRPGAIVLLSAWLMQEPKDIDAARQLGYEYMRTDQDSLAREVLTRVVRIDSMDASSWINLATVEKGLNRFPEAIAHYKRAFAISPALETANNNLNHEYGSTYVQNNDLKGAEAIFRKMLTAGPGQRARGLRSLGFLALLGGRYDEAAVHFADAVTVTRDMLTAPVSEVRNRLLLADVLDLLGRNQESATQRDSAFAVGMRIDVESTLLFWLGKALIRAGETRRGALVLQQIEKQALPTSMTDRMSTEALRAELLSATGKTADAVGHANRARLAGNNTIVQETQAWVTARAGGWPRAATLYEEIHTSAYFGWEGQLPGRLALYYLGRMQEQRGERELAAQAYQRFLQDWPPSAQEIIPVSDARSRLTRLRGDQRAPGS